MRVMRLCVLCMFIAGAMYGQRGGGHGGGGFRGGSHLRGGSFGQSVRGYGYGGRYSVFGRGYRSSYYPYSTFGFGFGYAGYPYVYDNSYYSYPYAYAPSYNYAPAAPPVVVEQNFGPSPQRRTEDVYDPYRAPENSEIVYLIAYKDHVIRAAVAYWVEGETLDYVDREHERHSTPLTTIDRAFSEQLNRDRRVDFRLPR